MAGFRDRAVQEGASMTSQQQSGAFGGCFEPLEIGDFTVRNRIVVTTHGTGLGEARDLRYLQERARGGAGLLGIHSSGGVYGYAVGPGPARRLLIGMARASPQSLPKASPTMTRSCSRVCAAEPKWSMPRGTLFRAGLPFRCSATWHQCECGDGPLGGPGSLRGAQSPPAHRARDRRTGGGLCPRYFAGRRRLGSTLLRSTVRTGIWSTSFSRPISIGAQIVGALRVPTAFGSYLP